MSEAPMQVFRSRHGAAVVLAGTPDDGFTVLRVPQGERLVPVQAVPGREGSQPVYTGVLWSPDGRQFAAYEALTFPFGDGYGRPDITRFTQVDIFTAAGRYVTSLHIRSDGIQWTRCGAAFPDSYGPADVEFPHWLVPPG